MGKTYKLTISLLLLTNILWSQSIHEKIDNAVKHLLADSSMKHALLGLCVVNSNNNEVVYDINAEIGLAPASCQKIFTSIAAMDILGHDYRFKTELGYNGVIKNGELNGNLFLIGYGDPTLGSWRFNETKDSVVLNKWMHEIKNIGIKKINGNVYLDNSKFSFNPIPGGWIWDDIGNYYGAGHWGLNWHENQYDLVLQPGKNVGDETKIIRTVPVLQVNSFPNFITTGKNGSGDNGYIYSSPYSVFNFAEGTIPQQEKEFIISGSISSSAYQYSSLLEKKLNESSISISGKIKSSEEILLNKNLLPQSSIIFYKHYSPSLDSVNYYFLKRSINLYGEALIKTMAYEKTGFGNTDSGIAIIKKYWQERGIEKSALHMMDGSGLSPQNRVTANALVTALQYAKTKTWYPSFYFDMPEYNQMKLKSGSINGARSFAGYHTAKDGISYTMAIIVNNYDGPSVAIVNKMFLILNELK